MKKDHQKTNREDKVKLLNSRLVLEEDGGKSDEEGEGL